MVRAILEGRKTQTRRPSKIPSTATLGESGRSYLPYVPGDILWVRETWVYDDYNRIIYRADEELPGIKWYPSIHMPRKACRLFLEVDDVGIHRLQDISEDEAKAEGMKSIIDFHSTWNKLYSALQYRWERNPWVYYTKYHIAELKQ